MSRRVDEPGFFTMNQNTTPESARTALARHPRALALGLLLPLAAAGLLGGCDKQEPRDLAEQSALGLDLKVGFQTPSLAYGADFVLQFPKVKREDR